MKIEFDVDFPGELAAGLYPYTNNITVEIEHDPGGEEGEFKEELRSFLLDWFDGAYVRELL
jgi:hypothetical protein